MAGQLNRVAVLSAGLSLAVVLVGCASSGPKHLKATLARQQQAEHAYASGNLAQALADYQALTHDMPRHADYWFRLGNVRVRMQQPDEAADAYRQALQLSPGHAKAWHNLGIVRLRQAEAAFGQSARYAVGVDAPLQQQSAQMADGIGQLAAPAEASDPASGEAGLGGSGQRP
ncbi:cytochrome c-type biogenesis protein CcmH/NrfG [Rhodanobacter sp. TND4EL1]